MGVFRRDTEINSHAERRDRGTTQRLDVHRDHEVYSRKGAVKESLSRTSSRSDAKLTIRNAIVANSRTFTMLIRMQGHQGRHPRRYRHRSRTDAI